MSIKFGTLKSETIKDTTIADFVVSFRGNDTLFGSKGNDWFLAGFGDDAITVGSGWSVVEGGQGSDTVTLGSGSWLVSLPQYYDNYSQAVDTVTGQVVGLSNVERLKIGTTTIDLRKGTDGNNTLNGTTKADYIKGLDGNDTIKTGAGNDNVSSGNGADFVDTGSGNDRIDDTWETAGGAIYKRSNEYTREQNKFWLGDGDDTVLAMFEVYQAAHDNKLFYNAFIHYEIDGGTGNDIFYLTNNYSFSVENWVIRNNKEVWAVSDTGQTTQFATFRNVEQIVDLEQDIVWTTSTKSYVRPKKTGTGTALSEVIVGTSGNDTLNGKGGFDYFSGGAGQDTVVLSGMAEFYSQKFDDIELLSTKNGFSGARLNNTFDKSSVVISRDIEKLKFTGGPGSADDKVFNFAILKTDGLNKAGTSAHDFLVVTQYKATDNQTLLLKAGNDHVVGDGAVKIVDGGTGNDVISWENLSENATILGGDGNDILHANAAYDPGTNITVKGGAGNDSITLYSGGLIDGGTGDDWMDFFEGVTALGGAGNDTFGTDVTFDDSTVDGGSGEDVLSMYDISTNFRIVKTSSGYNVVNKQYGGVVTVKSVEAFHFSDVSVKSTGADAFALYNGSSNVDKKFGGAAVDIMNGGLGDDRLFGQDGDDILAGDAGKDFLNGGDGDDVLDGGAGADTLTGGAGFDTFLFVGNYESGSIGGDIIKDFKAGAGLGDVIAFRQGEAAFDSFNDILRNAVQSGDDTVITIRYSEFDVNAGVVILENVKRTALVADDFIFL